MVNIHGLQVTLVQLGSGIAMGRFQWRFYAGPVYDCQRLRQINDLSLQKVVSNQQRWLALTSVVETQG